MDRNWLRRHALGSGVVSILVVTASVVQILNGLPDLVDRDLPWLGDRVNIGVFVATIWQLVWVVALVASVSLLIGIYRSVQAADRAAQRKRGEIKPPAFLPGHDLVGAGRDWIRCRCGWTGSAENFRRHQSGDPVTSTNVPVDPPPVPDRARLAELTTAAWQQLVANRNLVPTALNAEARHKALRLWTDRWMIDVEQSLAGDNATLTNFKRDVDTEQMHYIEHPALVLLTRLRRLGEYVPPSIRVEMDLQERWDTEV